MALIAVQFLVVFSASVINIAVPSIGESMGLSSVGLSWVISAYVLAVAALLLLAGRVSDIVGRRRLLLAGLALFAGASVMAAFAGDAGTLITARAVQGVGIALVEPPMLSLLISLAPTRTQRSRILGLLGAAAAFGGGAGVVLGGLLTQAMGWQGIFHATALLSLLLVLACVRGVPADAPVGRGLCRRDVECAVLLVAGLVALSYGVTEAAGSGWTRPPALVLLGAGAALLAVFLALDRRRNRPLVPLRIFTTGSVGAADLGMIALGTVATGGLFFLALYQQRVLGYEPGVSALWQVPMSAAAVTGSTMAPRLARRTSPRTTLRAGQATLAAGLLWLGRAPGEGSFAQEALAPSLLIGAGLGITFVQLTQAATAGVPAHESGLASGLVRTARMMGGVFGMAVLTSLAATRTIAAGSATSEVQALHAGNQAAFTALGLIIAVSAVLMAAARRSSASAGKPPVEYDGAATPTA
ncbi:MULTISPECIES: MFS transporter [unclassified Streptomyces]|uniref:MFS transporter n=1 Tax=unclassified Streptomyces TaxID=2593676 RepID=UPI001612512B|nr:MFS transporter [Streptomyces sp. I6]